MSYIFIMTFIISILISLLAGLSTVIGSLLIFLKIKKDNINRFIVSCLSFSMGVMIGISVIDLLPRSFFVFTRYYPFYDFLLMIIIYLIIVSLLFKFLNNFRLLAVEKGGGLFFLGVLSMITLIIHNLPEGMATFISSYKDIHLGIKISIAIMLHNIPEGICIAIPIYYSTHNKRKAVFYTAISGLSEPLGAVLSFIFLKSYINELLIEVVLSFVGVLMIYLSIEEILPNINQYNNKKVAIASIICGVVVVVISEILI